uniref:SRCR domain-containing protein n=1 Tax=Macrostomum lignano TaxID=282301 RepID=A0A1I8FIT1_9PLAT
LPNGRWNLNNDCDVKTGPAIPGICNERRLQLACELVELRPDSASSEGLGGGRPYWSSLHRVRHGSRLERSCRSVQKPRFANTHLTSTHPPHLRATHLTSAHPPHLPPVKLPNSPQSRERLPITGRPYKPNPSDPTENTTVEQLNCKPGDRLINCNWQSASGCYEVHNRLAVACNLWRPHPSRCRVPRWSAIVRKPESARHQCHQFDERAAVDVTMPLKCARKVQSLFQHCAAVSGETAQYTQYHLLMRFLRRKEFNWQLCATANEFRFVLADWLRRPWRPASPSAGRTSSPPRAQSIGHSGGVSVVEIYRGRLTGGNFTDGQNLGSVESAPFSMPRWCCAEPQILTSSWLVVNSCWPPTSAECHSTYCTELTVMSVVKFSPSRVLRVNRATTIVLARAAPVIGCRRIEHQDNGEFGLLEEDSDLQTGVRHGLLEIWLDRSAVELRLATKATTDRTLARQPGSRSIATASESALADRPILRAFRPSQREGPGSNLRSKTGPTPVPPSCGAIAATALVAMTNTVGYPKPVVEKYRIDSLCAANSRSQSEELTL